MFSVLSCRNGTDAMQKALFTNAPPLLCLQLMRFGGGERKPHQSVEYKEELFYPLFEVIKGDVTSCTDIKYQLIAVVVHKGASLSSGHYMSFVKRGGTWYSADDHNVVPTTTLAATSQQAYLVFYEKCNDDEVQQVQTVESFKQAGESSDQHPRQCSSNTDTIDIKHCVPPGFYLYSKDQSMGPKLTRTAPGNTPTAKESLSPEDIQEAVDTTTVGIEMPEHPRMKGWKAQDTARLLPPTHNLVDEPDDSLLSNFIMNKLFLMIEEKAQAERKKVRTLNANV